MRINYLKVKTPKVHGIQLEIINFYFFNFFFKSQGKHYLIKL